LEILCDGIVAVAALHVRPGVLSMHGYKELIARRGFVTERAGFCSDRANRWMIRTFNGRSLVADIALSLAKASWWQ